MVKWYPAPGQEFKVSCNSGCHDCEKSLGPFTTDEECIRVMRERGWAGSFYLDGAVAGAACSRCVELKRGPMFGQEWI